MILVMQEGADVPATVTALTAATVGQADVRCQVYPATAMGQACSEILLMGAGAELVPFAAALPGVARVVPLVERYAAIGRHGGALDDLGFRYRGLSFGADQLHVFAGLCAVDSRSNVDRTFAALAANGVVTARAGAYKPRTSPYEFQGHGAACLPYVFELAGRHGIQVLAMEVTQERQLEAVQAALMACGQATGVMLQIGTRNAQNFGLLREVGSQTELPVLFKRGMGISLEESLNACEYIAAAGNRRIVFALRGLRTHLGSPHRNLVDFAHVPVVRRLTRLPVCVDPSHSVGGRDRAPDGLLDLMHVTAQGVVAGANMVLVDFHPEPARALCDGPQALGLEELPHFLADVQLVRAAYLARLQLAAGFSV